MFYALAFGPRTSSTRRATCSGGVSGMMPLPRLNTGPYSHLTPPTTVSAEIRVVAETLKNLEISTFEL